MTLPFLSGTDVLLPCPVSTVASTTQFLKRQVRCDSTIWKKKRKYLVLAILVIGYHVINLLVTWEES